MSNTNSAAHQAENKMGILPIPKLLFSMALPMIISMMVQALYNIVDSMFVAQLNENALTAVSLVYPVQNLMIAVASGTGVGVNALLSRSLGEKNFNNANKAANNGILLAILSSLIFVLAGIFGSRLFFAAQTSDPQILEYGCQYMSIVCICSGGLFLQVTMERLLQSTGRTIFTMITQGTGAIINIVLDPILIFGYFGLPHMGVAGAAAATVIGQIIAMFLGIFFNLKMNPEIKISAKTLRFDPETVKNIYKVGVPSILMMSIGSVMTFGMNKILLQFSSTAAAVFGVYFKLNSIFFMPIFGLNNGMVPIVAYNYGARNRKRITQTIKLSCAAAFTLMFFGTAAFMLIPDMLLGLFNASEEMLAIGCPALRIISTSFMPAAFCIVFGSVFQAMGNGMYSLISSVCRQLCVLLPSAWILAKLSGLDAVWYSYPLAEIASIILSVYFLRKIYKEKIYPLGE